MKFKEIEVTVRNGLQIIKFNRPSKKNAITSLMYEEVGQALGEGARNDQVVITALTGAGDYYSSGNDITGYTSFTGGDLDEAVKEASDKVNRFVKAFIDFPKILVAVVNGPAIGVAATTLGLCDVVYASHKAYFTTPFASLGLSAEGCSSYTFPRIMGTSKASEMLYFNKKMSVIEAKEFGLVSEIFPQANMDEEVWPRLEAYAKLPALSMIYSKRLVRRWNTAELHEANNNECKQLEERWKSEDCMNAILEFFQKRSKV